jgi:bla regulator protein BlaR1
MTALFTGILRASWQASLLAVAIVALQLLLRRRLSAQARYALWSVMLLRLALPFAISRPANLPAFHVPPPTLIATHHPILLTAMPTHPLTTPIAPPISWLHRLTLIWLIGCVISAITIFLTSLRLSRHMRRQHLIDDPRILDLLTTCAEELKIHRLPQLLTGRDSAGPALVGFLRPRLLLPESILQFDDQSLRLILLHELAHHKRCDVPANWLLALLQTLHWFNPVVHVVFARIRADRELACDERVLSMTQPADRPAYGRTIVRLIESLANPSCRLTAPPAIGILEGRRQLRRRITMIAEHRPARRTWSMLALVTITLVAIVACTDPARGGNGAPDQPVIPVAGQSRIVKILKSIDQSSTDPRLARRIPELKFDSIPLSDALAFMRDQAKINLFIDHKALEGAGVDLNEPVVLDLKDITVEQAFRFVGKAVASHDVELGAIADGDVIVFGVLSQPTQPANGPGIPMGAPGMSGPMHHNGSDHAFVNVYDIDKLASNDPARLDTLVEVISSSINLSKSSLLLSIKPFNGKLVVTATQDVQDQVVNLLNMLSDRAPAKTAATKPAGA